MGIEKANTNAVIVRLKGSLMVSREDRMRCGDRRGSKILQANRPPPWQVASRALGKTLRADNENYDSSSCKAGGPTQISAILAFELVRLNRISETSLPYLFLD